MRSDVTFLSQGLTCRGWLYTPDHLKTGERRPALVMAHGFAGVKEVDLPTFAAPCLLLIVSSGIPRAW